MNYDARSIANWFIQRAAKDGRSLSIMSILKLVYIAHGWRLEMKGEPLFPNRIEAWRYGPVIPDVYYEFRRQGINPRELASNYPLPHDPADVKFLEQIYDIYGHMSPMRLSDLTHVVGGPWHSATESYGNYAPISDELIQAHYIVKRSQAAQTNG